MLGLGYVVVGDAEQQLQNERLQLVSSGAKTLANGSLDALASGDFELLERWVASVLLTEEYAYAFLSKPSGQILTHTNLALVAHFTEPVQFNNDTLVVRSLQYKGSLVREVIYPAMLGKQHLANAHVAYYLNRVTINQQSHLKIIFLIVISLIVMLTATLLIIRRYTRPISQLTFYVSQLNLGSDDSTIQPHLLQADEEIGVLARAFDNMFKRLIAAFKELRQKEERLRERVDEQTRDLIQANQELESFSYSVSHDLRAPLRTIDGFSVILSEDYGDKLDEDGQHTIRRIRSATQRMAELIDDILELSRVSRAPLETTEVDLSALAHSIAEELSATSPQRQVHWQIAPNVQALGDQNLLRVVMVNLLDNAWKYSATTQLTEIKFGTTTQNNKTTYFIRDNGAGFDMKYKNRLFKPFSRLHETDEFEGTGIGLATVKRILERHNGTIWAEAKPGAGAIFYFQLGYY